MHFSKHFRGGIGHAEKLNAQEWMVSFYGSRVVQTTVIGDRTSAIRVMGALAKEHSR
jgi:hypothetical protein